MTDWKELARKHEDSANHYAKRCYDLEALNAELVEKGHKYFEITSSHWSNFTNSIEEYEQMRLKASGKFCKVLAKARGES